MNENTKRLSGFEALLTAKVLAAMVAGGGSRADAEELLTDLVQVSVLLSKWRIQDTLQKEVTLD